MKNNKGFTLIELLAVIIILTSISLIAVSAISSSLQRRDESECNEQINLAKNAAKIYFSLNNCVISNENTECRVTISALKGAKYFDGDKKISRLDLNKEIIMNSNGYTYNGECH